MGYEVKFDTKSYSYVQDSGFNQTQVFYSFDNGNTWQEITLNGYQTLSDNCTQIKFKVSTTTIESLHVKSTTLGLDLSTLHNMPLESNNYTLTQDVTDLILSSI